MHLLTILEYPASAFFPVPGREFLSDSTLQRPAYAAWVVKGDLACRFGDVTIVKTT